MAVLLDSPWPPDEFREFCRVARRTRDQGRNRLFSPSAPASGWSEAARLRAQLLLSLGPMTMAPLLRAS